MFQLDSSCQSSNKLRSLNKEFLMGGFNKQPVKLSTPVARQEQNP